MSSQVYFVFGLILSQKSFNVIAQKQILTLFYRKFWGNRTGSAIGYKLCFSTLGNRHFEICITESFVIPDDRPSSCSGETEEDSILVFADFFRFNLVNFLKCGAEVGNQSSLAVMGESLYPLEYVVLSSNFIVIGIRKSCHFPRSRLRSLMPSSFLMMGFWVAWTIIRICLGLNTVPRT